MIEDSALDQPSHHATSQSLRVYRRIAVLFLLLSATVVAIALYVVLARATVVVLSKQEEIKSDFIVDVSSKPVDGEVAGEIFELTETVTQEFPVIAMTKKEGFAEGRVRITSTLSRSQTLIATTRLLTPNNVLFRLRQTVVVPANGFAEVAVVADALGAAGDVGSTSFSIPGLNPDTRSYFVVKTIEPIGGGVRDTRTVTKSDVENALDVLSEKMSRDMADRLREKKTDNEHSGEVMRTELLRYDTNVSAGTEAEVFSLTIKMKVVSIFYDKSAFDAAIRTKLADILPYGRRLSAVQEADLRTTPEKIDVSGGRANIRVSAVGSAMLSAELPALEKSKLTGVTVDAAKTYLEHLDGVSSVSVRVSPVWARRLPTIADHITVEVR